MAEPAEIEQMDEFEDLVWRSALPENIAVVKQILERAKFVCIIQQMAGVQRQRHERVRGKISTLAKDDLPVDRIAMCPQDQFEKAVDADVVRKVRLPSQAQADERELDQGLVLAPDPCR